MDTSKILAEVDNKRSQLLPVIIQIENIFAVMQNAVLFGHRHYADSVNYGSDRGIIVSGVSYERILSQSVTIPYQIGKFRFSSSNIQQLRQVILHEWYLDAMDGGSSNPIDMFSYIDAKYPDNDFVDIHYPCNIDKDTIFTIPMLPHTKMQVRMYKRISD